jgi:hypothetical protein
MRLLEELAFTANDSNPGYPKKVPVYKNPDPSELRDAFREHDNVLRAKLQDGTNDLYVWDAEITHDDVKKVQGYPFLMLPRGVRLKWYVDDGTPEEWEAEKAEFAQRCQHVWRAYGRKMPIIADNGEFM